MALSKKSSCASYRFCPGVTRFPYIVMHVQRRSSSTMANQYPGRTILVPSNRAAANDAMMLRSQLTNAVIKAGEEYSDQNLLHSPFAVYPLAVETGTTRLSHATASMCCIVYW